jgi:hypothetical protein
MDDCFMDDHTLNEGQDAGTGDGEAVGWPPVTALVVDVAGAMESHAAQDAVTEFIWHMLARDYQIYLCTSTTKDPKADAFALEDFAHPLLTWLPGVMPPTAEQVQRRPGLANPKTLWITDDADLQRWVTGQGGAFVSLGGKTASFAESLHLGTWGELGNVLDPTTHAARQIAEAIAALRRSRPGPVLVGIGGPPESGTERITLELKRELEAGPAPLVEVIDVTPLFPESRPALAVEPNFPPDSAAQWLVQAVLEPLAGGKPLLIEKPPAGVPSELHNVFPLYISAESVVLLMGENVFHRAIRAHLQLSILIEVAATETARRMFGVPEGEAMDAKFVGQYAERDGRAYQEYLAANQVVEHADVRIDGNSPRRFKVIPGRVVAN